jgi:hypothetical protein
LAVVALGLLPSGLGSLSQSTSIAMARLPKLVALLSAGGVG